MPREEVLRDRAPSFEESFANQSTLSSPQRSRRTQVNEHFRGKTHLECLREIIRNVMVDVQPKDTVTQCKKQLEGTYINIFDYVDGDYGQAVTSKRKLRTRCNQRGYFATHDAKSEG